MNVNQLAPLKKWFTLFFATGGFSGYLPLAPGTWGSLVGCALVWVFHPLPWYLFLLCAVLITLFGVWLSDKAGQVFKMVDSPHIVIDEIAGVLVTMVGIPITGYWLIWGFLLFRILDILKPPPARYFDSHVKNGWGVMLDDIIAGIYGNIILQIIIRAQI